VLASSVARAAGAGHGKHARRAPAEPDELPPGETALSAEAMLAQLAAESRKPLSGITGRLDSTASRVALMAGGIVAISALLVLVMAVIGSML
jgi:hypothetical protein